MNILEQIVEHKKFEVERRKSEVRIAQLEETSYFNRQTLSLKESLQKESKTGIIAEFKRKSPSKGVINDKANVADVTRGYAENGASALSVLTDEIFFGGSSLDLMEARVNEIPILRKDFIIDEYQLAEAKSIGADLILLIAACLRPADIKRLQALQRIWVLKYCLSCMMKGNWNIFVTKQN
jgi:indole-3-glycerol phosphate synthase